MNLDLFVRDLNDSTPESAPLGASVCTRWGAKASRHVGGGASERDGGRSTRKCDESHPGRLWHPQKPMDMLSLFSSKAALERSHLQLKARSYLNIFERLITQIYAMPGLFEEA